MSTTTGRTGSTATSWRHPYEEQEFFDGYRDGRDPSAPEPSENRSAMYRHSFAVGRAELEGKPILAAVSRVCAQAAIEQERSR
jgi:hypothetical protein